MTGQQLRRAFALDVPRWALVALLGFSGWSKITAWFLGKPLLQLQLGSEELEAVVRAAIVLVAIVETLLALALVFVAAYRRRILPVTLALACSWAGVLVVMMSMGLSTSKCGCLGSAISLEVIDHVLLSAGVILLCASRARRIRAWPWSWFRVDADLAQRPAG